MEVVTGEAGSLLTDLSTKGAHGMLAKTMAFAVIFQENVNCDMYFFLEDS